MPVTRGDDWPARESEGGRVVMALILGLALLAGGTYVAAYLAAGDKVPVGTQIAGVDVGGHSPTAAEAVLRTGLSSRVDTPFTVVINGHTQQVSPSDVGLAVDYAASVRKAGAERSWRPSHLWQYFTDGSTYEPVVTLDQDRLAKLIRRLDVSDGRPATDGGVVFRHQTFTVRPPRPGLTLDPKVAGTAFWNAYLSGDRSVQLRMVPTAPSIGAAAIHRFVRRFANPAMASSVQLDLGTTTVHLSPADYGHLLVAQHVGDRLRPRVRAGALMRLARARMPATSADAPQPATVALVSGRPHVVDARPGVAYRPSDVASALLRAITAPHRTASVRATRARASFTTRDARHLGIRQQLASYTVRLPRSTHGEELAAAAGALDGTVLKPQQSLSVRGVLGPGTPSGSGGSALATAMFNAAWLGGLHVTSHATATSYAGTAPPGRDASLSNGRDLAFTNDTKYGVLVSVVSSPATTTRRGSVTVTLWSTPSWKVTSSHGPRTQMVAAGRRVVRSGACTPRGGRDGFRVTVTRSLVRNGQVDHRTSYAVTYAPVDAVVCRTGHHQHHHQHHHH